jgi:hypothetical protein
MFLFDSVCYVRCVIASSEENCQSTTQQDYVAELVVLPICIQLDHHDVLDDDNEW